MSETLSRVKALISVGLNLFAATALAIVFCMGEEWLMATYLVHYQMASNICMGPRKISNLWSPFQSDSFTKVANRGLALPHYK